MKNSAKQLVSLAVLLCAWCALGQPKAPPAPAEGVAAARVALARGNLNEALQHLNEAIRRSPNLQEAYLLRARIHEAQWNHAAAVSDLTRVLQLNPIAHQVYQLRGSELFKMGLIRESISDLDRYLDHFPQQEAEHWQRGISYYYAGEFEKGRKQFELHQTVNAQDVENAVWHFLCLARLEGVESARKRLIPITGDSRVPMREIHQLFAGTTGPEAVLEAATGGSPAAARLDQQLFYAHLYLGLYYEAVGNAEKSREHLFKAETDYKKHGYMGAVARVHAELIRKREKEKGKGAEKEKEREKENKN